MTIFTIEEVCRYLKIKRTTFYNYKLIGLPVHYFPSGKPYCYKEEIDEWIQSGQKRGKQHETVC